MPNGAICQPAVASPLRLRLSTKDAISIATGRCSKNRSNAIAMSGGPSHQSHRLIVGTSGPARRGGVRFLQLRRAFLAAHLDGLPADRHLDRLVVELVVAGRAGLLVHELPPVDTRSPGISSRPPRDAGPLSRS